MWINGRWYYVQDEVTDDAGAAGGGGDGGDAGETGGDADGGEDTGDAGAGESGAAAGESGGAPQGEAPKDMKSAIDAALGYKKPEGDDGKQVEPKAGEKKPAPASGDGKETATHHANGKPKKNEKGEDLDAEGKVVQKPAPKQKTAAELDLKPEEKKALGPKAQQRFQEVIGALKAHEGTIATLTQQNKTLGDARDAILGVLKDTNTSQDQLIGYLQFNALIHSKDPKDIERAIEIVEEQRAALYKAIGKEPAGGGIDLLADFPDLAADVEDSRLTRERAIEIAQGRRERAAREDAAKRQENAQRTEQQTADQFKKARKDAEDSIDAWALELSKSDLDYKAKEDKLLAEVADVVKEYPPHLWLPTLKRLYNGIVIPKAPATGGGPKPLRPSGAKPGDKQPGNMLEAINQGLGYGTKG